MRTSAPGSHARFRCDTCDDSFNRQSSLVRHRGVKHSDAAEVFKCSQCPKILSRKDLLLRHEKLHRGEGLRSCWNCSRPVRSDYLPKHVEVCLRKTRKPPLDLTREPEISLAGSRTARGLRFAGGLRWTEVRCNDSEHSNERQSLPYANDSTNRHVSQPARFVASVVDSPNHLQFSREHQHAREATTKTGWQPYSFGRQSPRRSVSSTGLTKAIARHDTHSLHCEIDELRDQGLTLMDINELCATETAGSPPLSIFAVLEGNSYALAYLLHLGLDVNMRGHFGWTALHCACFKGDEVCASILLDDGAYVEVGLEAEVDDLQRMITPLWLAVEKGHTELARILIQAGADVNGGSEPKGPSPLQCACRNNDTETAMLLIKNGADRKGKPESPSPLEEAIRHGSYGIIKELRGNAEQRGRVLNDAANPYLQEARRWFPSAFAEKSPLGSP